MHDKPKPKQVSLAGAAAGTTAKKETAQKKRVWLIVLPLLLVVALLAVLLLRGCGQDKPSLTAREMVGYTVTPDALASDVSYFAMGVLGKQATDCLDMAAVMCYDRKAGKVTVLQMPVSTYIGEDGSFDAITLGDVWGNPKTITWCDSCRRAVKAEEKDGDKHAPCGATMTVRAGSSFGDYSRVFNTQYGLPIDNFLVIPRDGLASLIDAVDGVDIAFNETISIDGIRYDKGIQTLSGKAAMAYAIDYSYNGTPNADRMRILRQRQVLAGLLDRLSACKLDDLYNTDPKRTDVLSNVMLGRNPIRFDTSSFGKARLMGVSESKGENTKYTRAMAEFVYDISHVKADNFTFVTLAGVSQKRGTGTVYSVNKEQTKTLLATYMNPYGLPLDDTTVTVPQLGANQKEVDAAVNTLDKLIVMAEKPADK